MNTEGFVDAVMERVDNYIDGDRSHEGRKLLREYLQEMSLRVASMVYADIAKANREAMQKSIEGALLGKPCTQC